MKKAEIVKVIKELNPDIEHMDDDSVFNAYEATLMVALIRLRHSANSLFRHISEALHLDRLASAISRFLKPKNTRH